ncbi:MAG: MFS transporter [Candidatus Nanopelagicales bacterium]|nr:MFS transporter [Candidatus Nanopelagicales bacterium]
MTNVSAKTLLPTSDRVLRIQHRTVATLSTSQMFGGIAVAGSIPAGSLIAASIADSEAFAGLAQTAGVVGAAVFALPLARIALNHGRRPALALGYGLGALGALVVIFAAVNRNLTLILLGCLLVGVASAASFQARYAATDLALPQHRARSLSYVVWAATIGAVLGPNLLNFSGSIGLSLGLPQLSGPYVMAAVTLGLAVVVLLVALRPDPFLLATRIREHMEGENFRQNKARLRDGIEHLKTRPRAVLGIGAIAIGHVVMVMIMVMTPVHMAHVDVTLQLIGLVISVHVAGMYAFSPLVGMAVDRFGRIQVIVAGIIILAASSVISGLAPANNIPILGTGLFLLGLGWSCTLIAGSTLVTDSVEPAERPSVQGLSDLVMNTAGALGGIVAGLIMMWGSYGWLCAFSLVPLAALGFWVACPACRAYSNARSI